MLKLLSGRRVQVYQRQHSGDGKDIALRFLGQKRSDHPDGIAKRSDYSLHCGQPQIHPLQVILVPFIKITKQ